MTLHIKHQFLGLLFAGILSGCSSPNVTKTDDKLQGLDVPPDYDEVAIHEKSEKINPPQK